MSYQKKQYRNGTSRGGRPGLAVYTGRANPKKYQRVPLLAKPVDNYLRKVKV